MAIYCVGEGKGLAHQRSSQWRQKRLKYLGEKLAQARMSRIVEAEMTDIFGGEVSTSVHVACASLGLRQTSP